MFKKRVYGLVAVDLFIYVDNGRTIGPTKTLCSEASRRWGSACSWLGVQDAYRNVQPPSKVLGPWVGNDANTKGGVHGLVSQERWDKAMMLIEELLVMELGGRYGMHRERMESIIVFLV